MSARNSAMYLSLISVDFPLLVGALDDLVVHVGEVADVGDLVAGVAQEAGTTSKVT
jgi:hypothetical protein